MDLINRKQYWNEIYEKKHPEEVSWFQKKPTISLQFIHDIGNKKSRIIDVGGGTSTLTEHLLKSGYPNVAVLDISDKAIEYAKEKLKNQSDEVEWYVDDITKFVSPHPYDIWHDRAVFHFLTDKTSRELYVKTLKNTVNSGSHVIIATFSKDGPTKCSGLDIVQYDVDSIERELGDEFLLVENRLETHETPNGNKQNFIYFLFQRL